MNKQTMIVVAITALVVLIAYPKLKSLPGVSKLPTI